MKFDIAKCGICGKAFVGVAGTRSVCESCRDEEQAIYNKVRRLIRDNTDRKLTVDEVVRLTGIDRSKIIHLVDSGLLQIVKDKQFLDLADTFG